MNIKGIIASMAFISLVLTLMAGKSVDSTFIWQHIYLRNLVIEDPGEAIEAAHNYENRSRGLNEDSYTGLELLITGNVMWVLGDFPKALKMYSEALQVFEASDNLYGLVTTYNDRALIFIEEKNYEDGLESLRRSNQINNSLGSD